MGNGLMQEETSADGERYVTPGIGALIRQAGAEGCVLLKNDGALPLDKEQEVAVFGRCQLDWFYVGYGSGGDVNAPCHVNLIDGLRNVGFALNAEVLRSYETWTQQEDNMADHGWWGHWPMNYPEMPLDAALVQKAAQTAETALVVIGRAGGDRPRRGRGSGEHAHQRQLLSDRRGAGYAGRGHRRVFQGRGTAEHRQYHGHGLGRGIR